MEFGYGPTRYLPRLNYEQEQRLKHSWKQIFSEMAPDRTIQLAPIQKYLEGRYSNSLHVKYAYEHFETFGGIECASGQYGNNGVYNMFVQFKEVKDAVYFLRKGHCRIRGMKYAVKQLESDSISVKLKNLTFQEEVDPLSIVPLENSVNNILNTLDDDCLCLIFEQINQLADFVSITKVCIRFKRLAKKISKSLLKKQILWFADLTIENKIKLPQIEEFLSEFGSSVFSVGFDNDEINHIANAPNVLLKMVNKYCKNVQKLYFYGVTEITRQTVFEVQPLLSKLKELGINLWGISIFMEFTSFISACNELEYLYIDIFDEFQYSLPTITFPNLITFQCTSNDSPFEEFLEHNPQIEELCIDHSQNVCNLVASNMKNIREFRLNNSELLTKRDITGLKNMESLKVHLSYSYLEDSIRSIFVMKNITTLYIVVTMPLDHNLLIEMMQSLYNLKELRIVLDHQEHKFPTGLLRKMLQYANHLSDFHIEWPTNSLNYFAEPDYYDILETVKDRTEKIKLNLHIQCVTNLLEVSTGYRTKLIHLNMVPDWLIVTLTYDSKIGTES